MSDTENKFEVIEPDSADELNQAVAMPTLPTDTELVDTTSGTAYSVAGVSAKQADESKAKWYVLHTYSGYENMVVDNLNTVFEKNTTDTNRLKERLFEIKIPMEDVVEEKNGKFKAVERRRFPCYVFVKMDYDNSMWHMITNTRGVTGFVGPQGRPLPLTEEEIKRMKLEVGTIEVDYIVGEKVKVTDGALNGFLGDIQSLDMAGGKCRVIVSMFGRDTPVDLTFAQIEKLK
ncbi:MAG: transcription termination/antitermination protein NusG [Firmicutes bacterium]|nr:transcription termination/antitermination protein NusG [Bacillota bacterium]